MTRQRVCVHAGYKDYGIKWMLATHSLNSWVSLSECHINVKFVRFVCLSVCCSVRTFMTRKYTRVVLIYGYLQLMLLIAAFKAGLVHCFVHQRSTNM